MTDRAAYDAIPALSWSALAALATSPLLYQWRLTHPRPDTAALSLGRAIHCAVLEPAQYDRRYAVRPECDRRTKEGKATYAAWTASLAPGAEELTADAAETVAACASASHAHRVATDALRGARTEVATQWTTATQRAAKGRLDALTNRVIDLKTTRDAPTHRAVATAAARYLYHGQLAWYHDGAIAAGSLPANAPAPLTIWVQTVEPYDVGVYRMGELSMDAGRALVTRLLALYEDCTSAAYWPGVAPSEAVLDVPAWAPGTEMANDEEPWT